MLSLDVRIARVALVVYLLLVGLVVFQPAPELAVGSVGVLQGFMDAVGVPEQLMTAYRVEFILNTVLFMPLPFLGMLVFGRVRWSEWVVLVFACSAGIEFTQALLLDGRSATFVDVVSNTLGGLLGAIAGVAATKLISLRETVRG